MARRTKEEAQQTKAAIMDAAVEVFFEKGLSRATLEDIAETAGFTRGAVYWHFKNKQDLLIGIHEALHLTFKDGLFGSVAAAVPAFAQFQEGCIAMLRKLEQDEHHKRTLSLMITAMHADDMEELRAIKLQHQAESLKTIAVMFKTAMENGELRQSDPEFLAVSFFCYMCGMMQMYLVNPALFSPAKDGARMIANFFGAHNH